TATRRTFTSIATATVKWTTSTTTVASPSTTRGSLQPRSIESRPLTRKQLAVPASIRRRPGTDLSFTSTRAAIARGGRGPQEVDVAEHRRLADGGVMTAEPELAA